MLNPPGAKIFIEHIDLRKYICTLREDTPKIPSPNCWDLVGGGMKKGERPLETALREQSEEISLKLFGIIYLTTIQGETRDQKDKVISRMPVHIFKGFTNTKPEEIEIISEGQFPGYFSLNEILKLPNTVPRLKIFY